MIDINDYLLKYERNLKSILKYWYLILILLFIIFFIINFSFRYDKYYSNYVEFKDDKYIMYVDFSNVDLVKDNKKIKINNKVFAYKVLNIDEESIYNNDTYYKKVELSIDKRKSLDGEVFNSYIIVDSYSLTEYLFKTIWR